MRGCILEIQKFLNQDQSVDIRNAKKSSDVLFKEISPS